MIESFVLLMLCAMFAGGIPALMIFWSPGPGPDSEPEPELPSQEYPDDQEAHRQHMADCAEFGWKW